MPNKTELFFDTEFIDKLQDVELQFNNPKFEGFSLTSMESYEGQGNGYYTVIKKDDVYLLFYRANNNLTHDDYKNEKTCLAVSNDGITFERVKVNQDNNKNNNILFSNKCSHNFFPIFSQKQNKFLAIGGTENSAAGIFLLSSENYSDWQIEKKIIDKTMILIEHLSHSNHFDSHNVLLEDNNKFKIYLRDNSYDRRFVQLIETEDFNTFTKSTRVSIDTEMVYTSGIQKYPCVDDLYIGLSTFAKRIGFQNMVKSPSIIYSRDGINFKILKQNIFNNPGQKYFAYGLTESKNKDKFLVYHYDNEACLLECYSFRKNGLQCAWSKRGTIITKKMFLNSGNISLNLKTENLKVYLFDEDDKLIMESTIDNCDCLEYKIIWKEHIPFINGRKYYLKLELTNTNIYSIFYD